MRITTNENPSFGQNGHLPSSEMKVRHSFHDCQLKLMANVHFDPPKGCFSFVAILKSFTVHSTMNATLRKYVVVSTIVFRPF